jgi:tellurite resistance protein TehA-like permease
VFRLTHYADHQFGAHAHGVGAVVVIAAFAFETWYMLFGLSMLRNYFRQHVFNHDFHVSQWGLICPFVAYAVLGSLFYKNFASNPLVVGIVLTTATAAIVLFAILAVKQMRCLRARGMADGHDCPAQSISTQIETAAS